MIDHLSIQCEDVAASAAFYEQVLAPLGSERLMQFDDVIAYGIAGQPTFWLGPLTTGEPNRAIHIAFAAPNREAVRAFSMRPSPPALPSYTNLASGRIPRRVLRRVRARPRRQQRRSSLPHGVACQWPTIRSVATSARSAASCP